MRIISTSTHHVPNGYTLVIDYVDGYGRKWQLAAIPVKGSGSIVMFDNLIELRHWKNKVNDFLAIKQGKETFRQKMMNHIKNGDISEEFGLERIKYAYGTGE
jgi:hypothetical protein